MTNFLAILDLDNKSFHNGSEELKETMLKQNLKDIEVQVLVMLINTSDLDMQLDDKTVKLGRMEVNKRLENGSRLYYVWLRHLTRMVGKDFLSDKTSREAYEKLSQNNAEKADDRTIYEEKYIANLVKEFQLLLGNKAYADMREADIIKPYFDKFVELLRQAGKTDEEIETFRKYVFDRLEAQIDINSHPELQRKKEIEDNKEDKKETETGKAEIVEETTVKDQPKVEAKVATKVEPKAETTQLEIPVRKPTVKVVPEEKIQIPSFMQSTISPKHKVVVNGKEYTFRESDFPKEVRYNPNRLDFELIYNALKVYQDEVNATQMLEKPKKLLDKIAYRLKKFVASLSKTDYKMILDGREFMFDSNELFKYRSKNDQLDDMANLAYGKFRNEITYPNELYKTDEDFKNLLSGQIVHISDDSKDGYILVFDHDLKDEELHDAATRKVGYTRIAYEVFQRQQLERQRKRRIQNSQRIETKRKVPEDGFKPIPGSDKRTRTVDDDFGDL